MASEGVFLDSEGAFRFTFMPILLTLLLISFLDTLATLVALGSTDPPKGKDGEPVETIAPDYKKPMIVDALSCMFGAPCSLIYSRSEQVQCDTHECASEPTDDQALP